MKNMTKFKLLGYMGVLTFIIGVFTPISWGAGHEVYDVIVKRLGQTTQVMIVGNGSFDYKDFVLDGPPRIVIDCIGSDHNLPGPRSYALERGGIVSIRSSYTAEPSPKVRIIIDLKQKLPYVVFKEGNNLIIALDAVTAEPFAQWQASTFYEYRRPPQTEAFFFSKGRELVTEPLSVTTVQIPKGEQPTSISGQASVGSDATLINVEYENGDLIKIIRQFANWTNQNIVISPNVSGVVSVSLRDVPVRTALDIILKINGYAIVEEHGGASGAIWRVTTLDEIRANKQSEVAREDSLEQVIALKTEIVGIQYADASQIINSIKPGERGSIEINTRTNSLIVTDTPSNVARIQSMITRLDSPTQQVNIEAQVVQISTEVSRELGIEWTSVIPTAEAQAEGGNLLILDFSERLSKEFSDFLGNTDGTTTTVTLAGILSALESGNKAHVISRPNITVLNHEAATINSGDQVPVITRDETGNLLTEFVQTGVKLDVTPHVNPGERITLEVLGRG